MKSAFRMSLICLCTEFHSIKYKLSNLINLLGCVVLPEEHS